MHLNFFHSNFGKNFQILLSDFLFKMVLERGETQFLPNLLKFFRPLFLLFSLKIQTFISNVIFSREISLLLNFSGTHWMQFWTHWQNIFARGSQNNSEERSFAKHKIRTKFLRTDGRQFSRVCQTSFVRSSTSNRNLKFFQKYIFLTSFFGKCKKQFQQLPDGFPKVSKKFSMEVRKSFYNHCLLAKTFEKVLGTGKTQALSNPPKIICLKLFHLWIETQTIKYNRKISRESFCLVFLWGYIESSSRKTDKKFLRGVQKYLQNKHHLQRTRGRQIWKACQYFLARSANSIRHL